MGGPGGGVMWVQWYATILRQESFAAKVVAVAPIAMRYGATRYAVHRNLDDRYKITQMAWFENPDDWYRYWDGPEMIEFRARHSGHFQIPIVYGWNDELATGELGPEVPTAAEAEPQEPAPEPQAAA
jgi:hypothetical protein